jgi:hypothetical protein
MDSKFDKIFNGALDNLLKEGLIEESEEGFKITEKGITEIKKRRE